MIARIFLGTLLAIWAAQLIWLAVAARRHVQRQAAERAAADAEVKARLKADLDAVFGTQGGIYDWRQEQLENSVVALFRAELTDEQIHRELFT